MENMGSKTAKTPLTTAQQAELRQLRARVREHLERNGLTMRNLLTRLYPASNDAPTIFTQLTELKNFLDDFRPLNPAQVAKLEEAFDVEYTYNSNRIEGNTLTIRETDLVVNKGLTIGGKSVREHLEAINHHEAIAYIREIVSKELDLSETRVKEIHSLVLHAIDRDNAGRYRSLPVQITGSSHEPPQPYIVPKLMEDLFISYEAEKDQRHPAALAAHMHERLVTIHPFIDGNGRTARLIMNLLLLRHGYPIAIIAGDVEARRAYYRALEIPNALAAKENTSFQMLVAGYVKKALITWLEQAAGDISPEAETNGYEFFKKLEPLLD